MEKKNIYQKLTEARKMMLEMELKKSATNDFAKFKYMELTDIVPASEQICQSVGMCIITRFTDEQAITEVINNDYPDDKITFTSPFNLGLQTAQIKGVQAVGALHSYFRRYMLMLVFEIMEHDAIDCQDPKEVKKQQQKEQKEIKEMQQKIRNAIENNLEFWKKPAVQVYGIYGIKGTETIEKLQEIWINIEADLSQKGE